MSSALDFATELRLIDNALGITDSTTNVTTGDVNANQEQKEQAGRQERLRHEAERGQSDVRTGVLCELPDRRPDARDAKEARICVDGSSLYAVTHALSALEARRPRLGANVIVVDGRNVDVWVEEHAGEYRASEMDYDEGRPVAMRLSIAAALHDLQKLLMDEITECTACTDGECETHE